jgi:hypothetical protein
MAHFAEIGSDNTVLRVIVADTKEWCESNLGGTWVQTSYNTHAGQHPEGRPLHKNYAGVGYHWDGIGFYAPQPFPSWSKNEETYLWEAPVPFPSNGKMYEWNEETQNWDELPDTSHEQPWVQP